MTRKSPPVELPVNAEVELVIRGHVNNNNLGRQGMMRVDTQYGTLLVPETYQKIKPIPVSHRKPVPGQVWSTEDGLYFVRMSRADLPPRFTPADMTEASGPLKTLTEDEFFVKYRKAELQYNGKLRGVNGRKRNYVDFVTPKVTIAGAMDSEAIMDAEHAENGTRN